ncbi:MAG: hypothetical protein JWN04_4453 [Myxococcaceae bacterium]|nr:hypothetical protein [Myxococcaceae bacterium]
MKQHKARPAPKSGQRRTDWQSFVDVVEDYAIFMLDADGCVATWNRGGEKLKYYTADEIIGKHFSVFYRAEDLAAGKPEWELEVARAQGRVEDEGWRVRKDGSQFWANVVITALANEDGTLRGYTKVTRDLTAQRANEEALRRSEERFRLLVDSVRDYAMYMLDPTGTVSTWNAGAENLKGYKAGEIIGKSFSLFFAPEDVAAGKPQKELAVALEEGRFEEEGFRVRKDGSRFWANVTLTPIRDASGHLLGFAKVTRDLTARIAAESTARELVREQAARAAAELAEVRVRAAAKLAEEAAQRAEEANRVKDEFLATVSHELRTPLNAILGWASILRARNSDAAAAHGLEVVHRNALAQGRIIEDILDVSRIITGKLHLDLKVMDLNAIVREAIEVIQPAATAKNLLIRYHTPEATCNLVADAERLRQVAWNLLSNAAKFSEAGGTIDVTVEAVDGTAELTVADTGRGIDNDFLPLVFDRFKQADSSSTRRVGGLGLGLAIVRHLVELHGGQVQAASLGSGRGASFKVSFPIRLPVVEEEVPPPSLAAHSSAPAKAREATESLLGIRVLVVEDDDDSLELLEMVLRTAGATVETASSAAQGFDLLQQFHPDVLVSDIGMPGEDGYSFIRRIQALPPAAGGAVPAIALTAYSRDEDRRKALAMGFTMHLAKPVNTAELVSSIARASGRHEDGSPAALDG